MKHIEVKNINNNDLNIISDIVTKIHYNTKKTLLENKVLINESDDQFSPYINIDDKYKIDGYVAVKCPKFKSDFILIPKDSKIDEVADYNTANSFKKNWEKTENAIPDQSVKSKMNEWWDALNINPKLRPGVVISFTTKNINYKLIFYSPTIEKQIDSEGNWDLEKFKKEKVTFDWTYGYFTKDGKPYVQPKYSTGQNISIFIKEYWLIFTQILVSVVAGFLTGGQTLIVQALVQLLIDISASIAMVIINGDTYGAMINFVIGMIPFTSRLAWWGVKDASLFLKKYGQEMAKITTEEEFVKFAEKFTEGSVERTILKKVIKITPAEMKLVTGEGAATVILDGMAKGVIDLGKIPLTQRFWFQTVIKEGGVMIGASGILIGGKIVYDIKKQKDEVEKILNQFESNNIKVVYSTKDSLEQAKQYQELQKTEQKKDSINNAEWDDLLQPVSIDSTQNK